MENTTAPARVIARFWSKVNKNGPTPECRPEIGPCWVWTSAAMKSGYAGWDYGGKKTRVRTLAHRFAYEVTCGPIPDGLHIDHLCRRRLCVRPSHLEAVTQKENNRRAAVVKAAERTHCKRGHEQTPENRYRRGECAVCGRMRANASRKPKPPKPPRTHCSQGHPWVPENVYTDPDGHTECRTCRRGNFRAWAQERKGRGSGGGHP